MARWLGRWTANPVALGSKPLRRFKVDLAFDP